ncbi:hypothetical protein ScPMuIL_018416 [Solemya velum]
MAFRKREHACCWINEHKALVDFSDQAPSPCKDFYHVFVTPDEFHFRWWKIVPPTRADSCLPPFELKATYEDFLEDDRMHSEITRVAGENVINYLKNLAQGQLDYLPRLPQKALLKTLAYLDLEDIARLSQVSKQFKKLCCCDELWEKVYKMNSETPITTDLEQLAKCQGWKKLFFTNKLQLQVQLRRQTQRMGEHHPTQRMGEQQQTQWMGEQQQTLEQHQTREHPPECAQHDGSYAFMTSGN